MQCQDRGSATGDGTRQRRTFASARSTLNRLAAGRNRSIALLMSGALTMGALGVAVAATVDGRSEALIEFGPEDANTGYPTWYRDSGFTDKASGRYYDSVDLEPCLGDTDPMCLPAPLPKPGPANAKDLNMPAEFFYFSAGASLASNGGGSVLWEAALEGAWSAEEVRDGDQAVFGRIRIRVENLQPGQKYVVTHPQGEDTFTAEAGKRGINYTQDVAPAPKQFDAAFRSRVGPFLRWADDGGEGPPAGYIGDPNVGHTVVGSPYDTNYVRITGPEVGAPRGSAPAANPNLCPTGEENKDKPGYWAGAPEDCIFTDLFSVSGKLSKTGGVENNRATFSRSATGETTFDVFSRSKGSQAMVVRDAGNPGDPRFVETPLVGRQGKYYAHVGLTKGALPEEVTVANLTDDPDTARTVALHDLVTVTSASYDTATHELTVSAQSTDKLLDGEQKPVVKLTLPEHGNAELVDGTVKVANVPVAPATVKVASTSGDTGVGEVVVTGPASPSLQAVATGPATVEQGAKVTLSAASSVGQIESYSWAAPEGVDPQEIQLTGADTATPSFIAPPLADPRGGPARDLTFTVTVKGPGGTGTATAPVTVKVLPVSDPVAVVAPLVNADLGGPVVLNGTGSTGAATFQWTQTAGTQVNFGGTDTSPTARFTFPQDAALDPVTGDPVPLEFTLVVKNSLGDVSQRATVKVTAISRDVLTPGKVRYVESKRRWVIDGTAKILNDNIVTVHAGPTLDGPVIGRATVANVGAAATVGTWLVDALDSNVTLGDAVCGDRVKVYCVSIASSRGASVLALAVERADRLPQPDALGPDQQPTPQPVTAVEPATAAAPAGTVAAAAGAAGTRAAAGAAATPAVTGAVPLVGAVRLAAASIAAPAAVTTGTVGAAGIPVTVNVPRGITLLQVRVLASNGKPLYRAFQLVKAGKKAQLRIRSAKLRRSLKSGRRYTLEVRAGTSRTNLGKPVIKKFRVKR
jgi:hypothetical protein